MENIITERILNKAKESFLFLTFININRKNFYTKSIFSGKVHPFCCKTTEEAQLPHLMHLSKGSACTN